jgi:DNA modification methylase
LNQTIDELESLDWEFKRYRQTGINNMHWFPASFIPQIPSLLISRLSRVGDTVLDPFCGSGTTLIEAVRVGRVAVGIDSNPLACLISKVKTTFIEPETLKSTVTRFLKGIEESTDESVITPDFPNRDRWFHSSTLQELSRIFTLIGREQENAIKVFLLICFSSILKKCCSQQDHYTYVADNMFSKDGAEIRYMNAINTFSLVVLKNLDSLLEFYEEVGLQEHEPQNLLSQCKIINGNAKSIDFLQDESIDLVVTSPPYAGVTDYTTGHRLSFYWLFPDFFVDSKKAEIGARWKRFRHNSFEDYFDDLQVCFSEIWRVLKRNSFFCCVIGETSSEKKTEVINEAIKRLCVTEAGFSLISDSISRRIYAKRIRAKKGVSREHIMVFQKKG